MRSATRFLTVIVVLQGLLLSGCGSTAPALTPEQRDAALLRQQYSSSSTANAVAVLGRGGVTVYDDTGSSVVQPAAKPAGGMSATRAEAESMARDLADHAGYTGAQLDALADVGPSYVPPSFLLAGYAADGDTYGAKLSRALLADQNLNHPTTVLFPTITLLLFVSDAAQQWSQAKSGAANAIPANVSGNASLFAVRSADLCGAVSTFFSNTLNTLADKIVDAVAPTNVPILKAAIGFAVKTLLLQGIKILGNAITGIPFIAAIRKVLGVVGIMASIVSSLRNWSVRVTATPSSHIHYAVGDATVTGRLTATVDDRGGDLFSTAVRSCAELIKVDLPHAGAPGSRVEWLITDGIPLDATTSPGSPDQVVDKSNSASLQFTMSHESENAHLHGELNDDDRIVVVVTIRRADTAEVARVINELLAGGLGPAIRPFISGILSSITSELVKLVDPSALGIVLVSFHTEPNASPTPSASSSPPATPSLAQFRNSCELLSVSDVENILGASPRQQYFPPQNPGDGNACLYAPTTIDWKIPWSIAGLTVVPPVGWGPLTQGMTPISGIGDEAYFHDGPSDLTGRLAVRKGTTLMLVTISLGSGSARQVAMELAQIAVSHV